MFREFSCVWKKDDSGWRVCLWWALDQGFTTGAVPLLPRFYD